MRHLLPAFIANANQREQYHGSFHGYAAMIDISGFTALTQALMQHGVEGAEVLSGAINQIFTPTIAAIHQHGGFVSSFAGDAITALFPSRSVSANRLLSAAIAIRDQFERHGNISTKFGAFNLAVHIGIGFGKIQWDILPCQPQHLYWFSGDAIQQCSASEHLAGVNEIVCDASTVTNHTNRREVSAKKIASGYYRIESIRSASEPKLISPQRIAQAHFIPKSIRTQTNAGEFREVVSCFINLQPGKSVRSDIATIAALCHQFGGYLNKVDYGDKGWVVLVVFGAPIAHEKIAHRASYFAVALKTHIGNHIRIGLSMGTAFAGFTGAAARGEYTVLGMSVNLAARFMMAAEWGEVLLDSQLSHHLRQRCVMTALANRSFKGFSDPIPVHRLERKGVQHTARHGFSGQLIGRDSELEKLREWCTPIFTNKYAGIGYIYGEPGQGKSRLIWEFEQLIADRARIITLPCDGILQQPLNPFAYWIRQLVSIDDSPATAGKLEQFHQYWKQFIAEFATSEAHHNELQRIESLIAAIIGLEWEGSIYTVLAPKDRPAAIRMALKELVVTLAHKQPLILILEDLHWIDSVSIEVFRYLLRAITDLPLAVIVTSRYRDDGSKPILTADDDVPRQELDLNQLDKKQVATLLEDVLQAAPDNDLVTFIFAKAHGNPFASEQLAYYLQERNSIHLRVERAILTSVAAGMPSDLQGVLIARLDRLEAQLKAIVQTASVLGREFAVIVLEKMLNSLGRKRTRSQSEGLLIPQLEAGEQKRVWNALEEYRYIFNHSLLRDAAYQMQLKKHLKHIHQIAAETLVALYPDDKSFTAEIANHFDLAEQWEQAVEFYLKAGDYEKEGFHFQLALSNYQRAMTISLNQNWNVTPTTAQLHYKIGLTHQDKGEYALAMTLYEQMLQIHLALYGEHHEKIADVYQAFGYIYWITGEYDRSLEIFLKALQIRLDTQGDSHPNVALLYGNIGLIYAYKKSTDLALEYIQKCHDMQLKIYGDLHPDMITTFNNLSAIYIDKAQYDQALEYLHTALKIQITHRGELHPQAAICYFNIGVVHQDLGKYDLALVCYQKGLDIQLALLGETHADVADTYRQIAIVYNSIGDYDRSQEYCQKNYQIKQLVFGENHPFTASALNNIGVNYRCKGENDLALEYYTRVLKIQLATIGENTTSTANTFTNLGIVNTEKKEYDKALEYLQKSLDIKHELLGDRHPDLASCYNNIGSVYNKMGMHDQALEYFQTGLKLRLEAYGENHPDNAMSYHNIGNVYAEIEQFELAVENLERALAIRIEHHLEHHPHTIENLNNLAEAYQRLGNLEQSAAYRARADEFTAANRDG